MSNPSHHPPIPLSAPSAVPAARHCRSCARAMNHIATLPRTPHYPTQFFYRCAACPSAELIEVP
jgi:hypothetical protein